MIYNKKGNALGVFLAIFIFVFLVFGILISFVSVNFVQNKITEKIVENIDVIQDASADSVNATQIVNDSVVEGNNAVNMLQWLSYIIIAGLFIGIIALTYLVRTNPWWIAAYFIGLILLVIVSAQLSFAYGEIASKDAMSSTFDEYKEGSLIMEYLQWWVLMLGVVGGIIMLTQLGKKANNGAII